MPACNFCMREILAVKNFAHFHQSLGKVKLLLAKQSPTFNGVFFPLQHKRLDLKVSYFQNDFMKLSLLPKYEQNIIGISSLCSEGRNADNFLFIFWEKR